MIGTTVGMRFHIVSRIGDSWLFSVYRARDRLTERLVAVKVVRQTFVSAPQFIMALRQAFEKAIGISHPALVRYLAVGEIEDGRIPFLVCELVTGHDLDWLLSQRRSPLPLTQALQIVVQVIDGVSALHNLGLVHGDLRPHNILVTPYGDAKLTDYNLSSAFSALRVTETEWLKRASLYLAPERFQGGEATPLSDIYSLGVLLYQVVTGKMPFDGPTIVDIAHQHLTAPVPLAVTVNMAVPSSLDAIILRAMAKDPNKRFETANEIRLAVQEVINLLQPVQPSSHEIEEKPTKRISLGASTEKSLEELTGEKKSMWQRIFQSVTALIVGALLSVALVTFTLYWLLILTKPKEIAVPDVTGMSLQQAKQQIQQLGLNLKVNWEFNKTVPFGRVIRVEHPQPGRRVVEGREILITVSQGPIKVKVPNVIGLTVQDAVFTAKAEKLQIGERVDTYSETVPKGIVIGQQPSSGLEVTEGTKLNLIVSRGTTPVKPQINWGRLPHDAKVAKVSVVVGGDKLRQVVQIKVIDLQGERQIYNAVHAPGDKIDWIAVGRGNMKVKVIVNGQVIYEEAVSP